MAVDSIFAGLNVEKGYAAVAVAVDLRSDEDVADR